MSVIMSPRGQELHPIAENAYSIPISMGRLTLITTGVIWGFRNGTQKELRIRRIIWTLCFDGVGAATTAQFDLLRFSGANFTGGTAIIPVKRNTSMVISTVQDARQGAAAALTPGAAVLEATPIFSSINQRDKGATTTEEHLFDYRDGIVLNSGEGLCINMPAAAVAGDSIGGAIFYDEVQP